VSSWSEKRVWQAQGYPYKRGKRGGACAGIENPPQVSRLAGHYRRRRGRLMFHVEHHVDLAEIAGLC
jgi:hypothetical protein